MKYDIYELSAKRCANGGQIFECKKICFKHCLLVALCVHNWSVSQ